MTSRVLSSIRRIPTVPVAIGPSGLTRHRDASAAGGSPSRTRGDTVLGGQTVFAFVTSPEVLTTPGRRGYGSAWFIGGNRLAAPDLTPRGPERFGIRCVQPTSDPWFTTPHHEQAKGSPT